MDLEVRRFREPEHKVAEIFLNRWSPRAFTGEEISHDELMSLFEAAKWAPSSYNNQPWRFIYATGSSPHWQTFVDLLDDFNKSWAPSAGTLIVVASKNTFDNGKPSRTHAYDTGAAWGYLALQASMMGLVAHGMQGFDYDKAAAVLAIPDDHEVLAMAAVGHPGRKEDLPEKLRDRETPSVRKPLSATVFEGKLGT